MFEFFHEMGWINKILDSIRPTWTASYRQHSSAISWIMPAKKLTKHQKHMRSIALGRENRLKYGIAG